MENFSSIVYRVKENLRIEFILQREIEFRRSNLVFVSVVVIGSEDMQLSQSRTCINARGDSCKLCS